MKGSNNDYNHTVLFLVTLSLKSICLLAALFSSTYILCYRRLNFFPFKSFITHMPTGWLDAKFSITVLQNILGVCLKCLPLALKGKSKCFQLVSSPHYNVCVYLKDCFLAIIGSFLVASSEERIVELYVC